MDRIKTRKMITRHEGEVLKMYKDALGIWTIGVGHNLQDRGISHTAAMVILDDDINEVVTLLNRYLPWWQELDSARQAAIVDLGFNLGVGPTDENPTGKLLTFKNTLAAGQRGDFEAMAQGLENSLWYKQVGIRAKTIVNMIRTGEYPEWA